MAWIALLFAAWCLCCATAEHFIDKSLKEVTEPLRETVEDPPGRFLEYTGLFWPPSATVITVDDDRGFHLVFDADPAMLKVWLSKHPPWGHQWEIGGVPDKIREFADFGHAPNRHQEDLAAQHIQYCAKVVDPASPLPSHNYELLAIDSTKGRVYLTLRHSENGGITHVYSSR